MAARPNPAQVLSRKRGLVADAAKGRASASSSNLSASYGLPVQDVQRILREMGVHDDG